MELSGNALLPLLLPHHRSLFRNPAQHSNVEGRRVGPDVDGGFQPKVTAGSPDSMDFDTEKARGRRIGFVGLVILLFAVVVPRVADGPGVAELPSNRVDPRQRIVGHDLGRNPRHIYVLHVWTLL